MQSLADGVRTDAFDRSHRLVNDAPVGRVQGLEIHFASRQSHLFGEYPGLVHELGLAAAAVLADVDAKTCFRTELARGESSQDMLKRRERLTASPDQETVHRSGADADFDFFISRTKIDLGRNPHRRQQVLRQLAQVGVLCHQSLDANPRWTLAEQAKESAAGVVENIDVNLSGFRSQCDQGGLERFLDASTRGFHPLRHSHPRSWRALLRSRGPWSVRTSD